MIFSTRAQYFQLVFIQKLLLTIVTNIVSCAPMLTPSTPDQNMGKVLPLNRGAGAGALRSISFVSGKGGVGKSVLACNTAVALAQQNYRVLVWDTAFGTADQNLIFGLAPGSSMLDVVDGGRDIRDVIADTGVRGVSLLPALNGSARLADAFADPRVREDILKQIEGLSEEYDTLVIDGGSGIGASSLAIPAKAENVVVVATHEPNSLASSYATFKALCVRDSAWRRASILPNATRSPEEADEITSRLGHLTEKFGSVK